MLYQLLGSYAQLFSIPLNFTLHPPEESPKSNHIHEVGLLPMERIAQIGAVAMQLAAVLLEEALFLAEVLLTLLVRGGCPQLGAIEAEVGEGVAEIDGCPIDWRHGRSSDGY
jgi:hypothetical protein